jgi:hypothetical protein
VARDATLNAKIVLEGGDKVEGQLDDIADAANEVERKPIELRVDADVSRVLDDLQALDQDARAAAVAAEQLGDALGPELSARSDMPAIIDELKRMGLTAEQVTANAKELGAQLQSIDSPDLGGKLGQAMGTVRGETEKLTDSARGANSALANMVGNSAQDLGALGGLAGSAGVAIGQMAEYASDATLGAENLGSAIGSMAKVAGPIAILAAAMQLISSVMEARGKSAEAEAEQVNTLTDAYRSGISPAQAYADALREMGEVTVGLNRTAKASEQGGIIGFLGGLSEKLGVLGSPLQVYGDALGIWGEATADLVPLLSKAGVSVDQWSAAVMGGQQAVGDMATALSHTTLSADEQNTVLQGLTDSQEANSASKANAAEITRVFGDAQKEATKSVEELAAEQERAAQTTAELASVMSSEAWDTSGVDAATTAYQKLGDEQFALTNISAGVQASYDDLNAAIAENGFTFDTATAAGRANAEQIQNLYSSIVPSLASAFDNADGSMVTFRTNMNKLATETFQNLRDQTDLTDDQIREVMDRLGVFDDSTYAATFEMLGTEEAAGKLALLSGVIGSLPEDIQKRVTLAVQAGDPQAALDEINAWASGNPATVPSTLDPTGAEKGAEGFANSTQPTATIPVDADPGKAETQRKGFVDQTERTKPIVQVDANTQAAISTMMLLKILAALLAPTVRVEADIGPALQDLGRLSQQRPRVPVEAYLADYPTAGEIAARIGRPRIPVDIVVGQSIRITGVRE